MDLTGQSDLTMLRTVEASICGPHGSHANFALSHVVVVPRGAGILCPRINYGEVALYQGAMIYFRRCCNDGSSKMTAHSLVQLFRVSWWMCVGFRAQCMVLAVYFAQAKQDGVAASLLATNLLVFLYLVSAVRLGSGEKGGGGGS